MITELEILRHETNLLVSPEVIIYPILFAFEEDLTPDFQHPKEVFIYFFI